MAQVISVRFRGGTKNYYFDPRDLQVEAEQYVVVETSQGIESARCVEKNHEVPDSSVVQPLRPVVRIATENDHKAAAYNRKREKEAFEICEKKILDHRLDMKLVNVECNFEGNKIIFFFTPVSNCVRSACAMRPRCWAVWVSAADLFAAASFWRSLSPFPSRWPRPRI